MESGQQPPGVTDLGAGGDRTSTSSTRRIIQTRRAWFWAQSLADGGIDPAQAAVMHSAQPLIGLALGDIDTNAEDTRPLPSASLTAVYMLM
jgi:hypothetical protein